MRAQLEQIQMVLTKSAEMRQMLEAMLAQPGQMPSLDEAQFGQQIQLIEGVREELGRLQNELEGIGPMESAEMMEQKIKLAELVDAFGTLDAGFRANLDELERNRMAWDQINAKLANAIKNAEKLLADPGATLPELNAGIERGNEIGEQIGQILGGNGVNIPPKVMTEMKQGLRQLKMVTDMLAREYSKSMETTAILEDTTKLLGEIRGAESKLEGMLSAANSADEGQFQQEAVIQAIQTLEVSNAWDGRLIFR